MILEYDNEIKKLAEMSLRYSKITGLLLCDSIEIVLGEELSFYQDDVLDYIEDELLVNYGCEHK